MQARSPLPWQSVEGRSKGCLKSRAFRREDGKQHLFLLVLELGDRGNNSYCMDRALFEFSLPTSVHLIKQCAVERLMGHQASCMTEA